MSENTINHPEAIEDLLNQLSPFKRIAYKPLTQNGEQAFTTDSKFGGLPYLRNEEDWPVCPNCGKHMQLFLQLNLSALPVKQEVGLIQLFYCTTDEPLCESDCEAFLPFSNSAICRKVEADTPSYQIQPVLKEIFEEQRIVGWEPVDDYPHYDELSGLGVTLDVDTYELLEVAEIGIPVTGDKLYGWPHWIQSVEYPYDRRTGSRMELLFQLDSEDHLPYMFGDGGVGHLSQSKDNSEELAFGWACS